MYTDKVMVLQWHWTGVSRAPNIRVKGFDLIDIHPVATENFNKAFAGKFTLRHSDVR